MSRGVSSQRIKELITVQNWLTLRKWGEVGWTFLITPSLDHLPLHIQVQDAPRMGLLPGKLLGGGLGNYNWLRPCLWSYCINLHTSSLNSAFSKLG